MSDIQYDLFGNPVTIAKAGRSAGVPAVAEPVVAAPTSGAAVADRPNLRTAGDAGDDDPAGADAPAAAPTAALPSLFVPGAKAVSAGPGPTTPTAAKTRRMPAMPTADELAEGRALVALIEAMLEAARAKLQQRAGLLPIPPPLIELTVLAAAATIAIEQPTLLAQVRLILPRRYGAGGNEATATDTATSVTAPDEPAGPEDGHDDAEGADDDIPLGAADSAEVAVEA